MSFLLNLWAVLEPVVIAALGAILTTYIAKAANEFRRRTGMEISRAHQVALHEALISGLRATLRESPSAGLELLKASAIAHARQSVPDAIAYIKQANDQTMGTIVTRYLQEEGGSVTSPAPD
ncbi:hypothetical protein AN189_13025 [Loktanella sp. 3ANDIMAR09]|uniref:hypothetical protein n=1 Tax=Loktanella sp. 3ANDIMAR09 TaxID=1225657 RepID=UPI0006FC8BB7|nr:hypothetical protein [Loktanella sp. 3ANDIMAR09]KQI67989.1 hypothetical protein AN189_13025 [Loktanella sp. 3ANDIMAR09]